MEKMEKPVSNSPFSPFYAIGPPSDITKSASTPIANRNLSLPAKIRQRPGGHVNI